MAGSYKMTIRYTAEKGYEWEIHHRINGSDVLEHSHAQSYEDAFQFGVSALATWVERG